MHHAVIVGYARTPFTPAHKGALAHTRADDMAAAVIKALLKQSKVKAADVEDLIVGCAFPEGEQGFNVARLIGFLAGLPQHVAGMTVNRFCGSSLQAVQIAAGAIATGAGEVFICAGVESMSRVPIGGFNPLPNPKLYQTMPEAYMGMGETAENVAKKFKITRADQDAFALESQRKAANAAAKGLLKDEIVAIETKHGPVSEDGCLRPDTTAAGLADLKPAFDKAGSVTAGTSSPLTDGAAAVLVVSEAYAKKHKLPVLARIVSFGVSGCAPEIMGMGPVDATRKALERAGLKLKDIDVIELNEAFAAQSLGVARALKLDMTKVNLDGGALALGHPLGATGARIVGKAASLLKRTKGRYALATQCIGGGQGIAMILEKA